MKFAKSDFPVGAIWEGITRTGKIVHIWLSDRKGNLEIWRWSAGYPDGSGCNFDWATSYRRCVNNAPVIKGKFKRIKESKDIK